MIYKFLKDKETKTKVRFAATDIRYEIHSCSNTPRSKSPVLSNVNIPNNGVPEKKNNNKLSMSKNNNK